jgi:4-hydroxyphenylacetate 3-monooxygenase
MKMLATSAVYADEILSLTLWSRQPYAQKVAHEADYPLSYRFDETDSVLVCDRVKIPWERVFLHNDAVMSRRIYTDTPANCYQNHHSNIRFWVKMGLIVGVASRVTQANGIDKIPAVRETLGRLAALEATIGGLVHGQIEAWEEWPKGFATPNRRIMYAALNWCQEHHTEIVDLLRTLLGGIPLLMPASVDVMTDEGLRDKFERWWKTPSIEALDRYKLYKLAWDIVGSEFAGRHMLYEKFYAGNSLIVRNQSDREAPWEQFHGIVDGLLAKVETPKRD